MEGQTQLTTINIRWIRPLPRSSTKLRELNCDTLDPGRKRTPLNVPGCIHSRSNRYSLTLESRNIYSPDSFPLLKNPPSVKKLEMLCAESCPFLSRLCPCYCLPSLQKLKPFGPFTASAADRMATCLPAWHFQPMAGSTEQPFGAAMRTAALCFRLISPVMKPFSTASILRLTG